LLYIAFPQDLRDLYKDSQWLVYSKMVSETTFAPEDVLVLSEWVVSERMDLVQTMYRARQQGARVIYIGPKSSETDDFKRQMCLMGIYDFLFFGDEIVLGDIDVLLEQPRTPYDVKEFLDIGTETLVDMPPVVVVFEEKIQASDAMLEQQSEKEDTSRFRLGNPFRKKASDDSGHTSAQIEVKSQNIKRFVWPNPEAVRVRIIGDSGSGRSFLSWNLATLCGRRELPTAVVEDDVLTLTEWSGITRGIHVYAVPPKKGYRTIIDTRNTEKIDPLDDFYIVLTWPDKIRMEKNLLLLEERYIPAERVIWVINRYVPGLPLPVQLSSEHIVIPNDLRQVSATRMKTPLVDLDVNFAALIEPITNRISDMFISNARGGKKQNVVNA